MLSSAGDSSSKYSRAHKSPWTSNAVSIRSGGEQRPVRRAVTFQDSPHIRHSCRHECSQIFSQSLVRSFTGTSITASGELHPPPAFCSSQPANSDVGCAQNSRHIASIVNDPLQSHMCNSTGPLRSEEIGSRLALQCHPGSVVGG